MQLHRSTTRPALAGGLLALSTAALSAQLIANGGFKTDTAVLQSPDAFTAWQVVEEGILGGMAINSGLVTPLSGGATVGPASGLNYAVLDLAAHSQMSIPQSFTLGAEPVGFATLGLRWFANYGGTETSFIGIDEVSLTTTPVPEPATWAPMCAGLAFKGAMACRRV